MGYNLLLTVVCSLLIACTKFLATILYKNEFFEAWEYMPFLLISVVFSSLAGVLSGVFVAVKDSKLIGYTSFVGAVINIIFNIILISVMGPIGAAIATLISSLAIWVMRYAKAKKYIKLESNNLSSEENKSTIDDTQYDNSTSKFSFKNLDSASICLPFNST